MIIITENQNVPRGWTDVRMGRSSMTTCILRVKKFITKWCWSYMRQKAFKTLADQIRGGEKTNMVAFVTRFLH